MKGIALELTSLGIRANAIQPGMVITKLTVLILILKLKKDINRYLIDRYGKPKYSAFAAIYLLSDVTKWVTETLLTIDGGLMLR